MLLGQISVNTNSWILNQNASSSDKPPRQASSRPNAPGNKFQEKVLTRVDELTYVR
jgi:hypothetical protein